MAVKIESRGFIMENLPPSVEIYRQPPLIHCTSTSTNDQHDTYNNSPPTRNPPTRNPPNSKGESYRGEMSVRSSSELSLLLSTKLTAESTRSRPKRNETFVIPRTPHSPRIRGNQFSFNNSRSQNLTNYYHSTYNKTHNLSNNNHSNNTKSYNFASTNQSNNNGPKKRPQTQELPHGGKMDVRPRQRHTFQNHAGVMKNNYPRFQRAGRRSSRSLESPSGRVALDRCGLNKSPFQRDLPNTVEGLEAVFRSRNCTQFKESEEELADFSKMEALVEFEETRKEGTRNKIVKGEGSLLRPSQTFVRNRTASTLAETLTKGNTGQSRGKCDFCGKQTYAPAKILQLEKLKTICDMEIQTLREDLRRAKQIIAEQSLILEKFIPGHGPAWLVPSNDTLFKSCVDYFSLRTFDKNCPWLKPGNMLQIRPLLPEPDRSFPDDADSIQGAGNKKPFPKVAFQELERKDDSQPLKTLVNSHKKPNYCAGATTPEKTYLGIYRRQLEIAHQQLTTPKFVPKKPSMQTLLVNSSRPSTGRYAKARTVPLNSRLCKSARSQTVTVCKRPTTWDSGCDKNNDQTHKARKRDGEEFENSANHFFNHCNGTNDPVKDQSENLAIALASREGLIREIIHAVKKAKKILHFRFNMLLASEFKCEDLHFLLTSHRRFLRWLNNYIQYSCSLMHRFDEKFMSSMNYYVPATLNYNDNGEIRGVFIPLPRDFPHAHQAGTSLPPATPPIMPSRAACPAELGELALIVYNKDIQTDPPINSSSPLATARVQTDLSLSNAREKSTQTASFKFLSKICRSLGQERRPVARMTKEVQTTGPCCSPQSKSPATKPKDKYTQSNMPAIAPSQIRTIKRSVKASQTPVKHWIVSSTQTNSFNPQVVTTGTQCLRQISTQDFSCNTIEIFSKNHFSPTAKRVAQRPPVANCCKAVQVNRLQETDGISVALKASSRNVALQNISNNNNSKNNNTIHEADNILQNGPGKNCCTDIKIFSEPSQQAQPTQFLQRPVTTTLNKFSTPTASSLIGDLTRTKHQSSSPENWDINQEIYRPDYCNSGNPVKSSPSPYPTYYTVYTAHAELNKPQQVELLMAQPVQPSPSVPVIPLGVSSDAQHESEHFPSFVDPRPPSRSRRKRKSVTETDDEGDDLKVYRPQTSDMYLEEKKPEKNTADENPDKESEETLLRPIKSPLDLITEDQRETAERFYNHGGNAHLRALDEDEIILSSSHLDSSSRGDELSFSQKLDQLLPSLHSQPRSHNSRRGSGRSVKACAEPTIEEMTSFFEETVARFKQKQKQPVAEGEEPLPQFKTAAQVVLDILKDGRDNRDISPPPIDLASHCKCKEKLAGLGLCIQGDTDDDYDEEEEECREEDVDALFDAALKEFPNVEEEFDKIYSSEESEQMEAILTEISSSPPDEKVQGESEVSADKVMDVPEEAREVSKKWKPIDRKSICAASPTKARPAVIRLSLTTLPASGRSRGVTPPSERYSSRMRISKLPVRVPPIKPAGYTKTCRDGTNPSSATNSDRETTPTSATTEEALLPNLKGKPAVDAVDGKRPNFKSLIPVKASQQEKARRMSTSPGSRVMPRCLDKPVRPKHPPPINTRMTAALKSRPRTEPDQQSRDVDSKPESSTDLKQCVIIQGIPTMGCKKRKSLSRLFNLKKSKPLLIK